MSINLNPGTYVTTVIGPDGLMKSSVVKVLSIVEANDLTKKYYVPGPFKAKALDSQGNPIANQTITFNINGVFYNKITDVNGIAALNINLIPGKYIITSIYNGCSKANTVTINN